MFDFEDPWWIVAVVALIGLWVMEVAVPVAIFKPVFAIGNKYVDESVEEGPDLPHPEPLGMFWPVTGAVLSGLFLGVVFWRYWLSRGESRWMWMVVVAALTCTWALAIIIIAQKTAHHLAGG